MQYLQADELNISNRKLKMFRNRKSYCIMQYLKTDELNTSNTRLKCLDTEKTIIFQLINA